MVVACQSRDRHIELEPLVKVARQNGWGALVAAIRRVLTGARDHTVLAGLDAGRGYFARLAGSLFLPEPQKRPDPTLAAPGLAALIQAAASGDVAALQLLGQMGTHMLSLLEELAQLQAH